MSIKVIRIFPNKQFLFVLVFIFSNWSFSQITSQKFRSILEIDISVSEKEKQFDALLLEHESNNNIELILNDRYEILKWHYKQNNVQKSISLNRQNLFLMDSLKIDDKTLYRKNTYSLGYYLRRNNQEKEASKIFFSLINSDTIDVNTFKSYSSVAQMSYNAEDYYASAEQYETGLKLARKENKSRYIVAFSLGAGYVYKVIKTEKSIKRGITITKGALELLKQKVGDYSLRDKYNLYNLYDLLGSLYNDRDDYNFDLSLQNYKIAEEFALDLNDSIRLASVNNNLGYLYLHDNQKEANVYFNKALSYQPDITMSSLLHRNKAEYYLKNHNKSKALTHIQKSINNLKKIDTLNFESLPKSDNLRGQDYKYLLLSSIVDKAKIWIDLSELKPHCNHRSFENALETLKLADELVDIIRLETNENKSKLFWRETASDIYLNAAKVSFELNKPKEAFYFMEKNKALLLLEDLNKKQLLQNSNIPENIVSREASLSNEITMRSNSKAKENYRRFIDSLDIKYRMFYKSQKPAEVISLEATQNTIKTNRAILEFILDDNRGYGLLITKKGINFYEIKDCKTLKLNVQQLQQLLSNPFSSLADQDEYYTVSNRIYQSLFPDNIKNVIKGKSVTIIPDYYLQNIPFEALQTDKKQHSYLIFQNEINYAYSISLLNSNTKIARTNKNKLIGFAPIMFKELSPLKNSIAELENISNLFTSQMYIGSEATKSNFIDHVNDYNIIHIASHANAGINNNSNPWIAFHDKRLNLQELYHLNHQAELVVLSACETSLGETYKGEGVMSLTRGFFNSGANSVVSTLWNINDKSSTEIMGKFYTNLNNGDDKSVALHKAKLEHLKSSELSEKSPYYWASFVLIGDTNSIVTESNSSFVYYYIFAFILLIIITLFFRSKKI